MPKQLAKPAGLWVVGLPFPFAVHQTTLPAGEYTVQILSHIHGGFLIRSVDGQSAMAFLTSPVQAKSNSAGGALTFHRYGDRYFLSQVWAPGNLLGHELNKSRRELGLAKNIEKDQLTNNGWSLMPVPLQQVVVGPVKLPLLVLLSAVAFVLLIACANVANLLLARAATRQKEIALRMALGAGRWRVMRQVLTESLLLSLLGGAMGVLLALWGVELLLMLGPMNLPRVWEIGIDRQVLGFTLLVSLLTGMIFGLVPALHFSKVDLIEPLKEGGGRSTAGGPRHRMRNLLVISEVALALVLLIGASLMIKSFRRLEQVDPGFDPDHLITMRIDLPQARYGEAQKRVNFFEQVLARVRALPGVQAAGLVSELPLSGQLNDNFFTIEGRPPRSPNEKLLANFRRVSADYFTVMGTPLLKGRRFTASEATGGSHVVIINRSMAQQFFPGEDPLGKRLIIEGDEPPAKPKEIIGVVGDVQHFGLGQGLPAEMHVPSLRTPGTNLVVRTAVDPQSLAAAARNQVLAVDPDQPVSNVRTMEQLVASSVAQPRFQTLLLAIFATVALLLAAVGIFGVMSYAVTQRTHEIGVRMALGARRSDVLKLVAGQGMALVLVGVLAGLGAAFALTRVMSALLYEVSPTDPLIFSLIALLLTGIALLACYLPARRAAKVDPMVALRYE